MKRTLILVALLFIHLGTVYASDGPKNLFKEINRKMKIDFSGVELNKSRKEYVLVKFQIVNSNIEIKEINSSSEQLLGLIRTELKDMVITSDYLPNETYTYKFTFKKE